MIMALYGTGPITFAFLVSLFNFLSILCGRQSWLFTACQIHTIVSYRITGKLNILKCVSVWTIECFAASKVTTKCSTCSLSALSRANNRFCYRYSFIAPSIIRCLESARKSVVQVCRVASTVVMETTQPVLSQFKRVYRNQVRTE